MELLFAIFYIIIYISREYVLTLISIKYIIILYMQLISSK